MFRKRRLPIVVTHIPKTAGTSLRHYLKSVFGDRLVLNYRIHPVPEPRGLRNILWKLGYRRAGLPWNLDCIIGHFESTQYDEILPHAQHAIWFRDPVERIVSAWEYLRRNPEMAEVDWTNVDLLEFAEREEHRNRQYQRVGGRPLDEFEMVGVSEHFPQSLELFTKIFDLDPPLEVPRININPNRKSDRYRLSPEDRECILKWNQDDVRIYQQGQQRFQSLCRKFGIETERDDLLPSGMAHHLADAA